MLSVVHNYYYLLALLIIHSFRTLICVCKYLYMLSVTFDDRRGVGLMTLTFPLTSAGPGPTSAALKYYIFSAEIAIPLRLMLIPVFNPGQKSDGFFEILNSFQVTAFTTSYLLQPLITTFTTSGL